MLKHCVVIGLACVGFAHPGSAQDKPKSDLDALISTHAKANNVPESLVHRVVKRESRYNPRAVGRGGAMGLMQIKHATARGMGYTGPASGLLDADTNLTYAVRYLAGAYRVANGDQNRAVSFYARGYYYDAKRKGMLASLKASPSLAASDDEAEPEAEPTKTAEAEPSKFTPAPAVLALDSNK